MESLLRHLPGMCLEGPCLNSTTSTTNAVEQWLPIQAHVLQGPEYLPISWSRTPKIAMVSQTSKIPQNGVGNCLGLWPLYTFTSTSQLRIRPFCLASAHEIKDVEQPGRPPSQGAGLVRPNWLQSAVLGSNVSPMLSHL